MSDDDRAAVLATLTEYTRTELLGAADADGLTPETPLLDWGVLDSLKTARLVAYIGREFGVNVPPTRMNGQNFQNLDAITNLVTTLRQPTG
jgi:acyl carrier protein